jgi:hypothetical protein
MGIVIPILTDFDAGGINKATKKFQDLEGIGAKAHHALRKAAIPAALALTAVSAAAIDAVKSAADDAAAQEKLAGALKRTTGANADALKATEDFITKMSMESAISDDELRPALATLARGTGDLAEAQKGLALATDIAAATGKPLEGVSNALAKAYTGQYGALAKLDPSMKALIKSGASSEEIFAKLTDRFGGSAADAANTAQGRMKGLSIAIDETKESVGAALLPALQAVLPVLQQFGKWAQENPGVFLALAGAIVGVAVAIGVANVAMTLMALNPVALTIMAIVAAVALAAVGFTLLWKKSETFRTIVTESWDAVQSAISAVVDYIKGPVMAIWETIQGVINTISALLRGDFSGAWDGLKQTIGGVVDWIKTTILALPIEIGKAALAIGTAIVTGIRDGVTGLAEAVWGKITAMPGALLNLAGEWLEGLKDIGEHVISWIVSGVGDLATRIWNKIKGFVGDLKESLDNVADNIKELGTSIGDWIVTAAKGAISGLAGALKSAVFAPIRFIANQIKDHWPDVPGLPGPPGFLDTLGKLGVGATGGIVTRPTLAVIGEAGPEAVVPLNQMPGAYPLRAGGGTVINITVQAGLVSSPDQVGQQIIEAIQSAQRRSGPVFAAA